MSERPYTAAIQLKLRWDPCQPKPCGKWFTKAMERLIEAGGDMRTLRIQGDQHGLILTTRLKDQNPGGLIHAAEHSTTILVIEHDPAAA